MTSMRTHLERLTLLIERIRDAELLQETEGMALLVEVKAACQALEAGDTEAARRHVAQIARFLEGLVAVNALALTDGRAIIQTANCLLDLPPDAGDVTG